jgi:hypothetical protein
MSRSIHERLRRLERRSGLDSDLITCLECGLYPLRTEMHNGGQEEARCASCDQMLDNLGMKRMVVCVLGPGQSCPKCDRED